ncbi:MAG: FAD-binding dehydrogenase, partial [Chloroflexi bacterium]
MPKLDRMPFNRRAFIRGMLVAGAAVTSSTILIGCTPQSSSSVKWDEETDIVVIGAGGAGLTAAI